MQSFSSSAYAGKSVLGKTMARDDKNTKTTPAAKNEPAPKKKHEDQLTDKSTSADNHFKADSGQKISDSPTNYSRGEGQKPASKAYKENWNAIFAKRKKKKR